MPPTLEVMGGIVLFETPNSEMIIFPIPAAIIANSSHNFLKFVTLSNSLSEFE